LILASVLWTGGLLALMHMLSLVVIHTVPSVRVSRAYGPILSGLALMAGGLYGLLQSLRPFRRLRQKLAAVRAGDGRRLEGIYPTEVQPLIDDLNALLENREKALKRALAAAGDLAHDLKTPLALLAREAERAGALGDPELADGIAQQVERMSRRMNYHLARARASASGAASAHSCPVASCADALIRTVTKLYASRELEIASTIAPDLCARVQREDLDEMLGNLLDNACKWAKSRIVLGATRSGATVTLTVDDDGSGIPRTLRAAALARGVRIDESSGGSGLGLAIVRDLAEIYGGSVSLEESSLGGLSVRLSLPAFT
jgi:signal transduction histidine kinase